MIEEKYHRIVIDGTPYYREYYMGSGRYGDDLYTEEELVELLLEDVIEDTIEVDPHKVECAIRRIANHDDRNLIRNYLLFLERLMEN
ncbi:hypothetical protein AC623_18235 [Bacillus sp. FJAT-27231]|uniref:hypothetical protein n=1 Tax=Bacillus sp. FJAT-27231 TaxID=1679168 RepID=UPI000670D47C|nr:hypothetical protein [Bacillus sp. FJAT-27231]KMY55629.1 hypothetical protein AC623_18235 [Bacillus sp. FJAT-27231]